MGALIRLSLLIAASHAIAGGLTVRVSAVEATAGGTVQVAVEASGGAGLGALQGELVFDPDVLSPEAVEPGQSLSGALLDANLKKAGRVPFSFASTGSVRAEGTLLRVRFRVTGDAGSTSSLSLEKVRAWDDAQDEKELFVTAEAGRLTVTRTTPWALVGGAAAAVVVGLILAAIRRRPPAPAAARCAKCGAALRPEAKFCDACGNPTGQGARSA